MQLFDAVTLDKASVRKTSDGYLVADARIARTGIQEYTARELGLTDRAPSAVVRVYRPESAVFDQNAMAGLAHRPLTNDHPAENVTADTWKKFSIGQIGGEVTRDGEFVRVPLVMMDAKAIKDYEAGKRELSVGYSCEVTMQDGVTDKGEAYQAVQSSISANHLALCHRARGGSDLRIGDQNDPQPGERPMKTILVDGIPVAEVSDAAEAVINRLQGQLTTANASLTDAQTQVGALTTQVAAKDGEIVVLKKDLEDATSPANLEAAVKARSGLLDTAKIILGDKFDPKGKSDTEIKKAIVTARVGDALAATLADAALDGAYTAIAATAGKTGTVVKDGIRESVLDGAGEIQDARALRDAAREKSLEKSRNAYLGEEA